MTVRNSDGLSNALRSATVVEVTIGSATVVPADRKTRTFGIEEITGFKIRDPHRRSLLGYVVDLFSFSR